MISLATEIDRYRPAFLLDRIMHRTVRRRMVRVLTGLLITIGIFIVALTAFGAVSGSSPLEYRVHDVVRVLAGVWAILLGPTIVLASVSFFYNTLYYRGLSKVYHDDADEAGGITYEVASVCLQQGTDLTHMFLTHGYGKEVMARLGVADQVVDTFLARPKTALPVSSLPIVPRSFLTLADLGLYVFEHDEAFRAMLFKEAIPDAYYRGALTWVYRGRALHKIKRRWWSRDALAHIRGLGGDLALGVAYTLTQFARPLDTRREPVFQNSAYARERVEEMETILTQSGAHNVLLIGDSVLELTDLLTYIGRRIRDGESRASLEGKRLVYFDAAAFLAAHPEQTTFSGAFLALLRETERAGNIVLIIEHLTNVIHDGEARGIGIRELLNRLFDSTEVQCIATVSRGAFHTDIENDHELHGHFSSVRIETPDQDATIAVLEDAAWQTERTERMFFTYGALARVAVCADQYIVDGVMPEKALELLNRVVAHVREAGAAVLTHAHVDTVVSKETGMTLGPVTDAERDILLNLEAMLHARVVGQDGAVRAIAGAMRRARAGIQSAYRPIGSFLFLGSTGVGKTETAKALAALFFKSEDRMVRFDMSEYSGTDALHRLIGTSVEPGMLATALREHPYCVLLLDEFEKGAREVHDLFLSILDEGVFTDGRGMRVNARNTIIIATSNAGSARIWEMVSQGKSPQDAKDQIIDGIIHDRLFRPELINRFDATVIFETLSTDAQVHIAENMLEALTSRMKARGYTLVLDPDLTAVLMEAGYDPEFGARPMRRAIQDLIEEVIAEKIIRENLTPGSAIHIRTSDVTPA